MEKENSDKCKAAKFITALHVFFLIIPLLVPVISFAQSNKIFKENSHAIVVLIAYDDKGNAISQGSGFIVREDGAIVTNYHVISNAKDIKVKAGDTIFDVEGLIHSDKENDLVIIKIKGQNLPTVKFGDIEKANTGENVYVISSPDGLENTITEGILSGIWEITPLKKILDITAPISSGSSGGAVFNKNGEVIGVATFIIKEAQNLNFAMSINLIKDKISEKKVTTLQDSQLQDYKETAEYWFVLGITYFHLDKHIEAMDAFKQAIRIKPDYAKAHNNLGVTYRKLGNNAEAMDAYKQAVRIKPDYAEAHLNLGFTYGDLGKDREAMEAYKQAIRIKPDFVEAHFSLGITFIRVGNHKEAIDAFKHAIRIKPDFVEALFNLGFIYSALGEHRKAMDAYKAAIWIKPDYAKAHYALGVAYGELGEYRDAIVAYNQAVTIKPDYADAHYNLGVAYFLVDDRGSALKQYKILKDLNLKMANELYNLMYK
jgi:tetratricopeptide (TPR) repeat protein